MTIRPDEWLVQAEYDEETAVVFTLNRISVTARYPDNLYAILKEFNKPKTIEVIEQSKEVLKWLKKK